MELAIEQTEPMTYDGYMSEGIVKGRYDIIDGVRHFMTGASRLHNRIIYRLSRRLVDFEEATGIGRCYMSPSDILVSRVPLRTRQPDVFFMSKERIAQNPPEEVADPLIIGPELAVEVLSPSDTRIALSGKLNDYAKLGIDECWLVSPEACTVQVLSLKDGEYVTSEIYGDHDTVKSHVFPEISIMLDAIFEA